MASGNSVSRASGSLLPFLDRGRTIAKPDYSRWMGSWWSSRSSKSVRPSNSIGRVRILSASANRRNHAAAEVVDGPCDER